MWLKSCFLLFAIKMFTLVLARTECENKTWLSDGQKTFCNNDSDGFERVQQAGLFTLKLCRKFMQSEKWNCIDDRIVGDDPSVFVIDDGTKEAAILTATRAAGFYWAHLHSYMWNRFQCPQNDVENYRMCESAATAEVKTYLKMDILPTDLTLRRMAAHNAHVGMKIVARATRQQPHRMTDRCCHQHMLPNLTYVAQLLHHAYLSKAHMVQYREVDRVPHFVDHETNETINDARLIYLENTIDPCLTNRATMDNRVCHTGADQVHAERQCNRVCCVQGCFTRKVEQQMVERCFINGLGDQNCSVKLQNLTNFYCCPSP